MSDHKNATAAPLPADSDGLDAGNSIVGCCAGGTYRHEICSHAKKYYEQLIAEKERVARIDELELFAKDLSLPPDCPKDCKKKHWHHVAVSNTVYRIQQLKDAADGRGE